MAEPTVGSSRAAVGDASAAGGDALADASALGTQGRLRCSLEI